ncbi:radical SAM protein [Clostridium sediminicola]|uniref:elongator complex protein 3 n=1 Tax=Clostridium sediminicola TaxID=3114879 RepID=UPI0031F20474
MSKRHYIIPIFVAHEGCPHNCVFCNQDTITGEENKINAHIAENIIIEHLKTIKRANAIVEVSFYGGTFTGIEFDLQNELLEVAFKYKQKGMIDKIHLSTRPDYINKEILDNLKSYSVDVIELGVQSLDEEVLLKSGRGHSVSDVTNASKLIKEYGFTLGIQIMIGLPKDTYSKDIATAEKVISLNPDICRIYPALTIKNTPMEDMFKRKEYIPYTLEEALEITKTVYSMLIANDINVIRIGLQPTEEINENAEVIAGPFHPSIRELIESKIYNGIIIDIVNKIAAEEVIITVNNKDISKLYSNKKKYFYDTINKLSEKIIIVKQDTCIDRWHIKFEYEKICRKISIINYIKKLYKEGYFHNL